MQLVTSKAFSSTLSHPKIYCDGTMASERVQMLISELKDFALRYKIKQKDLAAMLGIKPQQLNDWFSGHRPPSADRVLQIQELIKTWPKKRRRK